MPLYPGPQGALVPTAADWAGVIALQKGEFVYVFGKLATTATQLPVDDHNVANETILAGQASIAINLQPQFGDPPPMVCVEGVFSAAPGTFEVDIEEADTAADGLFILPTGSSYKVQAVNATSQAFRADLSPTGGKFLRAHVITLTNAVNFRLKFTRLG
jgi:hypothetical protein